MQKPSTADLNHVRKPDHSDILALVLQNPTERFSRLNFPLARANIAEVGQEYLCTRVGKPGPLKIIFHVHVHVSLKC
jgi:hypothetical protein